MQILWIKFLMQMRKFERIRNEMRSEKKISERLKNDLNSEK